MSGWFHLNRSILSMTHCQIFSLWSQQGKSVLFCQPCTMKRLGCTDMKFSCTVGKIYFCFKAFCAWAPTKACWSHLYLGVQGCSSARDLSQQQLPSRAFTGTSAGQGTVRNKVKHHLSHGDSLNLIILIFPQYSWFSNVPLAFSHHDLGLFFPLFWMETGSSWRFSLYALDGDFWLAVLPFPPQTLSRVGMLPVAHSILSPTHQY